jgi:putative DNA primase/helicase
MPSVAKALLGDPVKSHSTATDWRYRGKGSLSVHVGKGTWYDYEADTGGGVLALIQRERRCSVGEALRWLESIGEYVAPVQPVDARPDRSISLRETALRIWRETKPIAGTIAERYLAGRGLSCSSIDVRFHPRCPFGKDEAQMQRYVPAMVALVRAPGDRVPMGIHRTELGSDGSKIDRKMLGPCHGGVVMISPHDADTGVGICEGIETGLAVIQLGGGPVWASLSAGSLGAFPLLGGVPKLTIFADNDSAGLEAAQKCARRWVGFGVEVNIQAPKEKGSDFADALARHKAGAVA